MLKIMASGLELTVENRFMTTESVTTFWDDHWIDVRISADTADQFCFDRFFLQIVESTLCLCVAYDCLSNVIVGYLFLCDVSVKVEKTRWLIIWPYWETMHVRGSIVVSIPACHAGNRGSIPRRGVYQCFFSPFSLRCIAISIVRTELYLKGLKSVKQRGAVEACWAHNSEVGRSKRLAAFKQFFGQICFLHQQKMTEQWCI